MSAIFETIDLKKHFRRTPELEGLDLKVCVGSVYGLLGANGAGKTTTLKLLMNIHRPNGGRAEVFGRDSRRLAPEDFTRIGYVSENQSMPGWMSSRYLMEYLSGFYPNWDAARAAGLLRQFDIPPERKLSQLSHGMRMKVALASSLAYRPEAIVLDEPFTGLDPLVRDELIEGVLDNAEGATILISSHDLGEIESFVSEIGYLDKGRLQFSEEMSSLTGRFREVVVTLPAGVDAPSSGWPVNWTNPERGASVVRFVDMRFEDQRTRTEVSRVFGEAAELAVSAMSLRSIFVTLAKAGRKAA